MWYPNLLIVFPSSFAHSILVWVSLVIKSCVLVFYLFYISGGIYLTRRIHHPCFASLFPSWGWTFYESLLRLSFAMDGFLFDVHPSILLYTSFLDLLQSSSWSHSIHFHLWCCHECMVFFSSHDITLFAHIRVKFDSHRSWLCSRGLFYCMLYCFSVLLVLLCYYVLIVILLLALFLKVAFC